MCEAIMAIEPIDGPTQATSPNPTALADGREEGVDDRVEHVPI
jgi:hypothetical protein